MKIRAGARDSPLSKAQVKEIEALYPHLQFEVTWTKSPGDRDKTLSLRDLEKSDLFTRDLDQLLLEKKIDVAIHSAKDLPDPLPEGLALLTLTDCLDDKDALVFSCKESLLQRGIIATSSRLREERARLLFPQATFVDLRGTIEERLSFIEENKVDGVIVAECALRRLGLTHWPRLFLPGPSSKNQGRLALVIRKEDPIRAHFRDVLYLGIDPTRWEGGGKITHFPLIATRRIFSSQVDEALADFPLATHLIFTSRSSVEHFPLPFGDQEIIAIGPGTLQALAAKGTKGIQAPFATQEGVIAHLQKANLQNAFVFLPQSNRARPDLGEFLKKKQIAHRAFPLYETIFNPQTPLDLSPFEEIVFTSPSTVEAFCKIYGKLPKEKNLTPIGPVTEKSLALASRQ